MSKPEYTIAVTGLNAIDSPGPGLAVIRQLREAESFKARIIGLSYESLEPGIYLHDVVDKSYQVPYPSAGQDVLFERFRYINQIENVDFMFPNFDAELFNFIKLQSRLEMELGIKMMLPTPEQFEARQKANLNEYGKKHGIKVPETITVFMVREIPEALSKVNFPAVVKGKFYDGAVVYTQDQAIQQFNKISAKWGLPILIQKHVKGTEVNVCAIGDGTGRTMGAVPMRKLYITDKGKAWSGVSLDDPKLLEITHSVMEKTKWNGPLELEFMKTTSNEYFLLEINPRFPAWCYLAKGCGQNQAEALVNLAMGNPVEPFITYQSGRMFIRYSWDMLVDISEFEQISTTGEL